MLRCGNAQVAALEQQLTSQFSAHPDAAIVRSQPGLGVVLGARVLGEFGDDPDRYQTAKGRKAFAGTAPVIRSSGLRTVVVARRRAISGWWMPAICGRSWRSRPHRGRGAAMTPTGPAVPLITRRSGYWAIGWSASCMAAWPTRSPTRSRSPGRRSSRRPEPGGGGAGGAIPRRYWPFGSPGGRWGRVAARSSAMGRPGSSAARSSCRRRRHHPAGEFGRLPRSRLTGTMAARGPGDVC